MRRPADKREMHVGDRQCPMEHLGARVWMEHHRGVDFLEDAGTDQTNLSAATFFGRSPDDEYSSRQPVERIGQRDARAGGGGRDQVVPATVAQATERVVLGQERDRRAGPIPPAGNEGGRGVGDAKLDAEPMLLEQLGKPGDRLVLFVADLRIGVNVAPDPFQLRPKRVDSRADFILQLADRRLGE
jgi:hypothetical protein